MARNKKGPPAPRGAKNDRGGRGARGGRGSFRGRGSYFSTSPQVNFIRDETVGFTLADEARQTSQHDHSAWGNSSLRSRPVTFVSAGPSEPLKLLDEIMDGANDESGIVGVNEETQDDEPYMNQEDLKESDEDGIIGPDDLEEAIQGRTTLKDDTPDAPCFFFDLKGDQTQENQAKLTVQIPERPSSRSSTSSDEVILFKGRGALRKPEHMSNIDMVQMQTEIRVVEQAITNEPARSEPSLVPELPTERVRNSKSTKNEKKQKQRDKRKEIDRVKAEEDAIFADYIANLKENSDVDEYFKELVQGEIDSDASELSDTNCQQQASTTHAYATDGDQSDEELEHKSDANDGDDPPSEIDDETLAQLIAGHGLGYDLGMEDVNFGDSLSDSDSDGEEPARKPTQRQMFVDDFDMMDWDRPSLRSRKGKGARAQINFNLSDSELEATLQTNWKNDRLKKSERKRQREEMRALGMLGKKTNPDDLRIKYPDGMNMDQVGDEMRSFMISGDEQLTLPPMDNHARKIIHDLANKFKIKSKSIGKGDQRRPTLYRTGRTLPYVEATFNHAFNRVNRKYLPRLDKGRKGKRLPPVRSGASVAAATYQDGEVVGGSAPELGIENRGRAMLEKMGWSMGTALGASDNKGIMQPVTQTMKRTKAGLG
ncbi:hypothetical protein FVEN_g1368 [Fusarium venenatum]|uniref:Protein SQS1 n=1 Tax=Fusarium venenatum TaxID=56646 RepID=A0A2L2SWA9_9HYPO|nr:uncharacterized protein FVRRES_12836 [Fusarium venenatum]KAG8361437.1 hypothetical protein FVEN_g1368 [Fusarium venenatum]KAH6979415.1 hypothetical protein EDB82DRAFT_507858 [Fusarium venenatum]CEI40145.1 unnamed protein product [Fusarium venenatum]